MAAVYPQPDHSPTRSHHTVEEKGNASQEEEGVQGVYKLELNTHKWNAALTTVKYLNAN